MSWVKLRLENKPFLMRMEVREEEISYICYLTDLNKIWWEELSEGQFAKRWTSLNADLEDMEVLEGLREVRRLMLSMHSDSVKAEFSSESEVRMSLDWITEGLPLHWTIVLAQGDSDLYRRAVTLPLLDSVSSLVSQRSALISMLRAKDLELEDQRGGGAVLSLPQLKTQWFEPEKFYEQKHGRILQDPLEFMVTPEVKQIMAMEHDDTKEPVKDKDMVDGTKVKNGTAAAITFSPLKLSSKRPTAKPDLSKYKDNNSNKKAKLNKL